MPIICDSAVFIPKQVKHLFGIQLGADPGKPAAGHKDKCG
jgi:hypothetical protein